MEYTFLDRRATEKQTFWLTEEKLLIPGKIAWGTGYLGVLEHNTFVCQFLVHNKDG
jgi:hypothetical protein